MNAVPKKKYYVFAESNNAFRMFRNGCPIQTRLEFDFVYVNSIHQLRGVEIKPQDTVEFLPQYKIAEKLTETEIRTFLASRTR